MSGIKINNDVYYVGVRDWDRRLFDELIPLPEGTTYNSYLILGKEKTALIDTADPDKKDIYMDYLKNSGVKKIDYIIANHAEQDHSGCLPYVLETYPGAKVVTNQKCKDFLKELLVIDDDKFLVIADKETLPLGGKTLQFFMTPWVHWPETMITYLVEDKILFSCDFFGSHFATSDLFVTDENVVYHNAKRYFAEIMLPFRIQIRKNVEVVEALKIEMIAPSHGPIYKNPKMIIDAYKDWISDKVKPEVLIPYTSMHGSVEKIVQYLTDKFAEKGLFVKPFNLNKTDIGELAMALVDASTIIIGSPMVLAGPHPSIASAAVLVNALRPKTRFISVVGSFGWGGKLVEVLTSLISNVKAEVIEPVLVKGVAKNEDFKKLDGLIETIVEKNKNL
ncbi:MAG: FprA family A-type flavoprotein [Spirochaetes bacterium]|nr:FprA family A-type flavoprotein [Spirochaetota bacterium]